MLPPETIRRSIEERLFGSALADSAGGGAVARAAVWAPASGGLSGASVWRVARGERAYAVRRWEADSDPSRSLWTVDTLRKAYSSGLTFVAAPLEGRWPLREGDTRLWEAAEWKAGAPLSEQPDDAAALRAAAEGLARFHAVLQTADRTAAPCRRAFEHMAAQLASRPRGGGTPLVPRSLGEAWPELEVIGRLLPLSVDAAERRLQPYCGALHPLQPVHGDARPEHFLVSDGQLTGLIDFGAMRVDTVLADIARLAGELALGNASRRDEVVGYYEAAAQRPVNRAAVAALDLGGAVLSAQNWLRWLENPPAGRFDPKLVRRRLRAITARLIV